MVGSEKSTLSNCAILGSGKTFGDKIDALYVLENNLAPIESVTGMLENSSNSLALIESVTGVADQGESTPLPKQVMQRIPQKEVDYPNLSWLMNCIMKV